MLRGGYINNESYMVQARAERVIEFFLLRGLDMTRKIVLQIAAGISAFIATPVLAADMAVKVPPPMPVPVATTWTGCYVNAGVGSGFFAQEFHRTSNGLQTTVDQTAGGHGWLGTVGGGCDYQFNSNFVVGVLADYDFMNLNGHLSGVSVEFEGTEKERSAVAAGGRIGYLVTPQILAYINGGFSSTRFSGVSLVESTGPARGVPQGGRSQHTPSTEDLSGAAPR